MLDVVDGRDTKESEIFTLKKERRIQSVLLKAEKAKLRNRSIILVLVAALLATLFIIFFQKSQNRKYAIENAKIQSQLQEERIHQTYERSLLEAEVIAMQMKINPHFLFNSLNSIKLLIQQNENKKAISYLVHLARFNRALLELEGLNTHSLSDKIQFAESYLRLENKRFQDDFSYSFTYHQILEEELSQYCVPPLLLQPYLENAIWHGLLPCSKKDRKISLSFTKSENTLIIELDDNGIGRQIKPLDKKTREGKGMGITKQRIDLFNKANEMNIEINIIDKMNDLGESLGTCVVLEITSNLVMA